MAGDKQTRFTLLKHKYLNTYYPLSTALIVVIWVACMAPVPETPLDNVSFIDKWTHFAMYGTLTTCLWTEYAVRHDKVCWRRLLVGGVLAPALMGGLVELAQAYLTTYRSGDWFDALCNALGVVLGAAIGTCVLKTKHIFS